MAIDPIAEFTATWYYRVPFHRDNPVLAPLVDAYLSGGARPTDQQLGDNHYARGLVALEDARRQDGTWAVEAPRSPFATYTNAPGLAINITTKSTIADAVIDGTGDTAILLQKDVGGSTVRRVKMTRVAALNAVSYGKHGVYCKAPNVILEDIDASCSQYAASVFSLRFDGIVLRRFKAAGAPHAITYYETSSTAGQVLVEHGSGSFTGDTGIWMDAETDYQTVIRQAFVFRDVHFTGPSSAKFLKVAAGRMAGSVRVEGCTLNGRPVTTADIVNAPVTIT